MKMLKLYKKIDIGISKSRSVLALTRIGIIHYLLYDFNSSSKNLSEAIEITGIDSLQYPIMTYLPFCLANKRLNQIYDNELLNSFIEKQKKEYENRKMKWFEDNEDYINLFMYEFYQDERYLIEAYRNVINRSKGLTNNNKIFYFSYVIPQTILKLHNNIKEFQ